MPSHPKFTLFTLVAVLTAAPSLGLAQSTQNDANPSASDKLEEVVVTGSLIRRALEDVAQPLTVIKADELTRAGATNPEQIMHQISQNQTASVSTTSIGRRTAGSSYANLRSLGSERTLVLVNGKRLVNSPYQSIGVDLNTVPTSLVERVEVLADGGSATYGTDAIAGVINFITAKEFAGLETTATAITPEDGGGGQNYLASLNAGVGSLRDNGWNIYGGATYRKAMGMRNPSRDFSATGFIPERGINGTQNRTPIANYSQDGFLDGATINPANPTCAGPFMLFADGNFGPNSCAYDVLARNNIAAPQKQWSVFGRGTLRVGESHDAYLEYARGDNRLISAVSPQAPGGLQMHPFRLLGSDDNGDPIYDLTTPNPYYPGNAQGPAAFPGLDTNTFIRLNWRDEPMGRRTSEIRGFTDRVLAGLEGKLGGWDYQVSAMLSSSSVDVVLLSGYPNERRIRDGFTGFDDAAFLNPFGEQSAEGSAFLDTLEVRGLAQHSYADLKVYSAQVNRELFRLPGGPVQLAAAIESKTESASFRNNSAVTSLIPATFSDVVDITGNRDSYSGAIELNFPVLEHLDLGVAARYDHYEGFGSTTNPTFSARFEPLNWLTLRGSYSKSFRAPTLYNVFQPRTLSFTDPFSDPLLCPGGSDPNVPVGPGGDRTRDCEIEFDTAIGGSADLDPEKSNAYNFGILLNPFDSLSFGVDYWNYHVKQTIGELSPAAIFGDPIKYADKFVRCDELDPADDTAYTNCTDFPNSRAIAYIEDRLQNLGDTKTSGFDVTLNWTGPETAVGRFGLDYRSTYIAKYEFQREPGGEFFRRAGRYFDDSAVLRYVHFLTATWVRGAWTTQVAHRYRRGYTDCNEQCVDPEFFQRVRAFSTIDLSGTYQLNDHISISGTIVNLFDQAPPFTQGSSGVSSNWDDRYADPRLRTYLLTFNWRL